jgi:acyl carrier protein
MKEQIFTILSSIRPESDFEASTNFVSDGLLDSFDIVLIVDELEEAFDVRIEGSQIVPENFDSVSAIERLISESRSSR